MKKHRGWMIANLALAFIACCLASSRIGDWRPYRFLDDARISDYHVGAQWSTIYFTSPKRMEDLVLLADAELAPRGLVRHMDQELNRADSYCSYLLPSGAPDARGSVHMQKSLGRTLVIVSQPPSISDHIRSFLSRVF